MYNKPYSKFLILGDYNLPNIRWISINNNVIPNLSNVNNYNSNILNSLSYTNLIQHNLVYNRAGSMLDLVFSNINNVSVSSVVYPLVPLDRMYHPALLTKISVLLSKPLNYKEQIYDFTHCDYFFIRSHIVSIDWNAIFKNLNINDAVSVFYENIFRIIDLSCTKKYLYTPKYPLWFSKTLKQLISKKKIAHKVYKRYPTQYNYNQFSNIRAWCKSQNKFVYNSFIADSKFYKI